MAFHALHVPFSLRGFAPCRILLRIEKFPRASIPDRNRAAIIVLENSSSQVFSMTRVETVRAPASQNIKVICRRHSSWWAWVDLNYRPRPYQGRALAT